jgi:DNA-binding MarR family transcriptional regulator
MATAAHPPAPRDAVDAIVEGWRAGRPDLDVDPIEVVLRIRRVSVAVERATEETFARFGLTAATFTALAAIARLEGDRGVLQTRLVRELKLTSGTVSVRIDRLVADGLAARARDPDDGRGMLVSLTSRGRDLFERAAPAHLDTERRLLAALSPGDRERLADLLRVLLIDLEGPAAPPPAGELGLELASAHETAAIRGAAGGDDAPGLLVRAVAPGGPAERAGVREGDVVTGLGDRPVRCLADLQRAASEAVGGGAPLHLVRGGSRLKVAVEGVGGGA